MQSLKSPLSGSSLNRLKLPKAIISYKASASNLAQSVSASRIITARAKLGETSLFGGDTSSLIGGGATGVEAGSSSKPKLEDVALNSELGLDFTALREHLQTGDYRKADDETRALLIKMAGEGAVKRGWVYFSEIKSIPNTDLQTMDNLWKVASGGKFGYSVQRDIWNQQQKRWAKFIKQLDWVTGENNIYRKWPAEFTYSVDAPRGHLPLTNALRGTQLFEALLEHPAFEKSASQKGKTIDDLAKEKALSASQLSSGGGMF